MKLFRDLLLLCISPLILLAGPWVSATAEVQLKDSKHIVLCGHPDYPPLSWAEEDRIVGLAPEVVKRIFNRLGYEVETRAVGNWKRCLREVAEGRVDVVVAYRTLDREGVFDFSQQPVFEDPTAIFVNRNSPFSFERWEDLKGKTVGLMLGDSVGDEFDHFLQDNLVIERVSEGNQNFGKLAREHIDFIPYGLYPGKLRVQQMGYQDLIVPLTELVATNYFYLAVSRQSGLAHLLDQIDSDLKGMHDNAEVNRLTEQYIRMYSSKLQRVVPTKRRNE